ncbi:MAG: TrkH family potassium uptake protein [Dehalococcoidia bacterium]
MRLSVVVHYSALLLIGIGLCMLLPFFFSLGYGESDTSAFGIAILITGGSGLLLYLATSRSRGVSITRREALAFVTLSWILASLFGALPYQLAGTFSSYLDCFFETISGFTTTGASVMTSIEGEPHGILLWRNFTQWLGGMGIVVLFVSLFPLLGMGRAYLFEAEAPGPEVQRLKTHIRDTSRTIWILYLGLSVLEIMFLVLVGKMPVFDSLCHTFGTMATGGFSPRDLSIGAYDSLSINIIVICFMFMAGINFVLYYNLLWRRSIKSFWESTEFRLYAAILVFALLVIGGDLILNGDYAADRAFEEAAFHSVSIQTTTGFAVSDFGSWPPFSQIGLLVLMIIGASAGSTGGGLKVVRAAILLKYAHRQVLMAFNPKAVIPLRMGGRVISEKIISRIIGFTIIYLVLLFTGTLIMAALEQDFATAVSSVIATIGNIGPGLGLVGPVENYAAISAPGKVILTLLMLVGRLEILTVLAILTPTFWRWR